MRITNQMLTRNTLQNLNRNLRAMSTTQEQMSSGKKVSKPSDDPIATAQILSYKTFLGEQKQHLRNIEDGIGWIDVSESAVGRVTDIFQRARELAVYGASGTIPDDSRKALAREVDQLIDELVQVANTNYAGRYVFGGAYTAQPPFARVGDSVIYDGDGQAQNWEVAPGVTLSVNISGIEGFDVPSTGSPSSLFASLFALRDALDNGDISALPGSVLSDLDKYGDHTLNVRAELGAKSNRLSLAKSRTEEAQVKMTEMMSKLEDIDLAETVMYYKNQEAVYQASLATAAMVLQPSLINFLR
ncbi:hypothetical protein SY88_04295 [Clostridiales bacterium PH28_bin88]|nr:hypothetical protein SY88_04295 [Clostridiales bacterium PH28_bin88]